MRELKFRVWDKLTENFIYPTKYHQWHYISISDGKFYNLQNNSGGDEYVVHQFTGLKDKNGKEIYEGDIVRVHYVLGKDVGVVVWSDCLFGYEISYKRERHGESESLRAENLRYEVIGNVFEQPELLER